MVNIRVPHLLNIYFTVTHLWYLQTYWNKRIHLYLVYANQEKWLVLNKWTICNLIKIAFTFIYNLNERVAKIFNEQNYAFQSWLIFRFIKINFKICCDTYWHQCGIKERLKPHYLTILIIIFPSNVAWRKLTDPTCTKDVDILLIILFIS